jgi:hypothetical protein
MPLPFGIGNEPQRRRENRREIRPESRKVGIRPKAGSYKITLPNLLKFPFPNPR